MRDTGQTMLLRCGFTSVALALVARSIVAAPPAPLPGFPVSLGRGYPVKGLSIADLDGGGPELVVVVGEGVAVIGADGKVWPGFPKGLRDAAAKLPVLFAHAPAACDLDGDGKGEILLAGSSKALYAVNTAGSELPGFPVPLSGLPRGPVSCLPVGGGRHEAVLTTDAGELVAVGAKGGPPRVVGRIGRGAESGVAIADLDGDGTLELIAGGGDSKLYVFDAKGKPRRGFPYQLAFRVSAIPSVGDVDDDGRPDILFGAQDFKLHAVDRDGAALPGFPIATGYRIYAGVALADLNGDGVLELVVGSGDKTLYAVDGRGRALPGFPFAAGERIDRSAAIGDVDRDGTAEILFTDESGRIRMLDARGRALALPAAGDLVTGAGLADLNGDGLPELCFATKDNQIHALGFSEAKEAEAALLAWPQDGHDAGHSGRHAPNGARFKELGYDPAAPYTTDPLTVRYRFFDLDWDREQETQIRWYKNGKHQPELDNRRSIDPSLTRKHERWRYTLQEGENFRAYKETGKLSRVFSAPEIEIRNTRPTAPAIALGPKTPPTTATLEVQVTTPSQDADGDPIVYRYVWLRDGKTAKLAESETRVPAAKTRKHEEWQVVVVPYDGEEEGATVSARLRVVNTPPTAPRVELQPAAPRHEDAPRVTIVAPAVDADGDPLRYSYRYWVDDRLLELDHNAAQVPPRTLRKHEKLRVEVTAHDDEVAGGKTEASATVLNTAPPAATIAIFPAKPRTADDLQLNLLSPSRDVDLDPLRYQHQWTRDGVALELPVRVPSRETAKGQRWRLEVTPHDGEVAGAKTTVEVQIGNTAPEPPWVTLPRYAFATDETIAPQIVRPARDDDADPVRLRYRWTAGGAVRAFPETKVELKPAETRKGESWQVEITPHDGQADGASVRLAFAIVNTPPTAPVIALSHEAPTTRDRVTVRIASAATDKDGDTLTYRYRWLRDGRAQSSWPLDKAALEPGEGRKGQRWRVEVRAFDGESEGEAALAELGVINHPPAPPRLVLEPAQPTTGDELWCRRAADGVDPDGDPLTYQTRWLVDGQPAPGALDGERLFAAATREKQVWSCEVVAHDGALSSTTARSASVTIANSPPRPPAIAISPAAPLTSDDLLCQLTRPADDADLDRLSYRFAWLVDGKPFTEAARGAEPFRVPAGATRRGQRWECRVTAYDGEAEARLVQTRVTIQNSTPTAPKVRIVPERPAPGAELRCELVEAAQDADGDQLQYTYTWSKDGVVQAFAPTSVSIPGRLVKAKDLWSCAVTAGDGAATGPAGASGDVMVVAPR